MRNKYFIFFFLFTLSLAINVDAQENCETILKVHSNFYKGLTEEDKSTAFEMKRVYLGYKGDISDNFRAEAKLDIGSPEDQSQYSLQRRYAYFKTAYLEYHQENLSVYFGLFAMMQFDKQEKNWGYRYITKSFMDEYNFGPSADIGVGARYKWNDYIETDIVISNGEGYKNLQSDNSYKTAFAISFFPLKNTLFRLYYDFLKKDELQSVFAAFLGYTGNDFRLGAEWNNMYNKSFISGQNLTGFSFYSTYAINDKWGIFGRYDYLSSTTQANETLPWNIFHDGSSIISGIEYTPAKNINCAINYQDWVSMAANGPNKSYIYFNLEFKL